jgi:hypothetical protein
VGQTRPALAESPRIAEVDVEAMTCPAPDGLAERLPTGSKQAMAEVFSTHLAADDSHRKPPLGRSALHDQVERNHHVQPVGRLLIPPDSTANKTANDLAV